MSKSNELENPGNARTPADRTLNSRTKSLWRLYSTLSSFEAPYHPEGIRLLDEVMDKLDEYTAEPNMWHNTAMAASRIRHHDAELEIVQAGLREWEDNVDLLCDELQLRYSTSWDLDEAQKIWERLDGLDKSITGPYWRFWVYGAIYHSVTLNDPEEGMRLLDEALRHVRRDGLMNVFGSYRRILVDSIPWREILEDGPDDGDPVQEHQREALDKLESAYRTGIELGVENGYKLAINLARLHQERAAMALDGDKDYLTEALKCLDLAEVLYTGSPNHPVTEIYEAKIRVLMAQREYGQALILLRSLPQRTDPSLETMYRLALQRSGEKLDDEKLPERQTPRDTASMGDVVETLTDEERLYQLAQQAPPVAEAIFKVAYRIQQEMEQRHD